jgi:Tol biopolymer transport system component
MFAARVLPARRATALAMTVLVALLLLVGLFIVVVGTGPELPPPFGRADNGRIAFVKGYHIFSSDPLGGDVRQLTFGDGGETEPRFSPDGTHVAYRQWHKAHTGEDPSANDAMVANADGSNATVVAARIFGISHISWSPDSRYVAFSGSPDGGTTSGGYVAAADGSGGLLSIGTFGGSAWDPTWAPDGKRLVIVADTGMWVVDRDGANAHVVTHDHYRELGSRGESAEWSPDGTQILFTAITLDDRQGVYVLTLDGSSERNISGDTFRARDASWSPDGTQVAYMRTGTGTGPHCVVSDPAGRAFRDLGGAYGWYQPIWSPDGTKVVVTDDRPGPDDNEALPAVRVILDVAGREPPIVIPAPGTNPEGVPDWAASWQRVAP